MRHTLAIVAYCMLPAAAAAEDDYVPLAVGLRREASVELTDAVGKTTRGRVVREVVGTEEVGGRTYLKETVTFTDVPGFRDFTLFRRKAADGMYTIRADDPDRKEYQEVALPLKVGSEWTVDGRHGKTTYRIEAKEDVTVGSKKYERCFKVSIKYEDAGAKSVYYLAPGRGNVLEESELPDGRVRFTLESFEVKKP